MYALSGQGTDSYCSVCKAKFFLAKYNIPVFDHLPYSSDMAPCGFYLFPKVTFALKETRFQTTKVVKGKNGMRYERVHRRRLPSLFQTIKILIERSRNNGGMCVERSIN